MNRILSSLILIALLLLSPFLLLVFVLGIPFDYARYRRSAFYQNTKRRYTTYFTKTPVFSVYHDLIEKHPTLTYHGSGDSTYLLLDDFVILCGYEESIELHDDTFVFTEYDDEQSPLSRPLDQVASKDAQTLLPAHRHLAVRYDFPLCADCDVPLQEKALACPHLFVRPLPSSSERNPKS